jgi:hypothetical protein
MIPVIERVLIVLVFNAMFQHTIAFIASINGGGRTQKNPWKETLTNKKLLATFLTHPNWLTQRLEPMQTEVRWQ